MMDAASGGRVESAIAGKTPLQYLTTEERAVVNSRLNATIAAAVAATDFGEELRREGITTVALDEAGRIVEHRPDGTTAVIDEDESAVRRVRADFSQAVGDVVFAQLSGERLVVGDRVAVYDLDTETYDAVVQQVCATSATLLVDFTKVHGAA